jgi:hypothetical protein
MFFLFKLINIMKIMKNLVFINLNYIIYNKECMILIYVLQFGILFLMEVITLESLGLYLRLI